ncbi:MAG: response regulator transcription factor [Eubacteriales bacterium]|nr:response regulator transcription factor [Eubacteriales bacterium]
MGETILIVDDENDIVDMLKDYFQYNGYCVLTAGGGAEAVEKAGKRPDLILLDINMPDLDGLQVCAQIRNFVSCPILFLTARIEDSDKIKGFGMGGDDYIVKPFSLEELGARVAAHLRREQRQKTAHEVKFGPDLAIDYLERCLYVKGKAVALAKKEFDIIELLSQHAGQVFDKERIYERVWGYDSEGDSSVVAEHIRRIRMKLGKAGLDSCVETVWGVGYKWVK